MLGDVCPCATCISCSSLLRPSQPALSKAVRLVSRWVPAELLDGAAGIRSSQHPGALDLLAHCLTLPLWSQQESQRHWKVRVGTCPPSKCGGGLGRDSQSSLTCSLLLLPAFPPVVV